VRAENTTRDRDLPGRPERVVDAMLDVDVEAHATVENITMVVARGDGASHLANATFHDPAGDTRKKSRKKEPLWLEITIAGESLSRHGLKSS
jgi:hypothetical protein